MSSTEIKVAGGRLSVDHSLCSGTGHCRDIAPQVFRVEGRSAWLNEDVDLPEADAERLLLHAVDSCPWFALAFERSETT